MNKVDKQYKKLVQDILNNGIQKNDRTGTGTINVFRRDMRFDMNEGFPLLTTKKVFTKSIFHELLWFLGNIPEEYKKFGRTNIKYLVDNNVNIWNGDTHRVYKEKTNNEISLEDFKDKIKNDDVFAKEHGNLGPIYGEQWRNWGGNIDQLSNIINELKENPDSRRLIVSAWNVMELPIMGLPPCFLSDTKIKTKEQGYINIDEILIGDLVITEDGSYQKVYDLHKTKYNGPILNIRTHGSPYPLSCTPNHPFLVKDKGYIEAKDINENDYVGISIPNKEEKHLFKYNFIHGTSKKIIEKEFSLDKPEEWYFMGYFLGDGWLNPNKGDYFISVNDKQENSILEKINNCLSLSKLNNSGLNCKKFTGKNKKWYTVLKEFGHTAKLKKIPDFILNGKKELVEKFIEGYVDADGYRKNNREYITTISDNIAFGIQRLYSKIGKKCSLNYQKRPKKTIIENREVNQNHTYNLIGYDSKRKSNNFLFDKNILWMKVKKIDIKDNFDDFVYNISVEKNHTYTANNIINHNCHIMYQFYSEELTYKERYDYWIKHNYETGVEYYCDENKNPIDFDNSYYEPTPKRKLSLSMYQRSVDVFLGLPFNIASYATLLHMVSQVTNMVPNEFIWSGGDCHIYKDHIKQCIEQCSREPFNDLPTLEINKNINNINDFTYNDLEVKNYQSHKSIKGKMST